MCPHLFFAKYKFSIFHDGNVVVLENPNKLILKYMNNRVNIVLPKHRFRNNIVDEFEFLKKQYFFNRKQIKIIEKLLRYKTNFLSENRFIIRKHNSNQVINLMNLWWRYYQKGIFRDQLSFPVICKIKNVKPYLIDNFLNHHLMYYVTPHSKTNLKYKLKYFFVSNIINKILFYFFKIKHFLTKMFF